MNAQSKLPSRLHHNAWTVKNLETTRQFYEDMLGLPLVATWCEKTDLFGKEREYCHCFFGIGDESALAFFQFANADDDAEFNPADNAISGFRHIALKVEQDHQDELIQKVKDANYPQDKWYFLEHGYCHSLYIIDPDGLIVEFCTDHPDVDKINAEQLGKCHDELKRWLGGDHSPNNEQYHRDQAV